MLLKRLGTGRRMEYTNNIEDMNDMNAIRFGQIKREEKFFYNGQMWKRTRGRFAIPVLMIGTGSVGCSFNMGEIVYKI